jgi:ABC-2 type transport system permease protein
MIKALFYLQANSWKNRMWMRIKRLKQPKYLLGLIFGVGYFFLYLGRWIFIPLHHGRVGGAGVPLANPALFEPLAALVLFTIVVLAWVIPRERGALSFTEAEVAFLFPAPVSRRSLIHFRLIKAQLTILFTILFFALVFGRFRSSGTFGTKILGWYVILSTLNLHFIGSSFARTMLLDRGISTWLRRTVVLGLVGVLVAGVAVWARQTLPPPEIRSDFEFLFKDLNDYLAQLLAAGPMPYLIYPFRLVVRPYYAQDAIGFLRALWPALLVMAVNYLWVIRSNVAFEEASVEASKRTAEKLAAMRANRGIGGARPKKMKRAPFELKPTGLPSVALLWKNLIHAGHSFTPRFWLILAISGVAFAIGLRGTRAGGDTVPIVSLVIPFVLIWSLLIGPQFLRQDFRQDLPMVDVLKTYPLKGWQIALGELMAPALILTFVQWFLILLGIVLLYKFGTEPVPFESRISIAFSLAVLFPALNLISLVIPNAAVLYFPGWFQTGKDAPQGIEATGQRMIFAFGQLFVFIIALVPAGFAFGMVYLLTQMFLGPLVAIPSASVMAAIVLGAEAWLGILLLGKLFGRFDVSADGTA